ncbi:hypothetical protein QBC43DRAFT_30855 [Cladorrhinum sp. PSN259]|nr:hypothetical protein QBC43DRAFT_30855 [Cladorrhinum sp. PSN259]
MPGQPRSVPGHGPRSSLSSSTMRTVTSPRVHSTENGHDEEEPPSPSPANRSSRNLSHEQLPRQVRFTTTGTHVAHGRVQKPKHRDHSTRPESVAVTAATQFLRRTITPIPDTQPPDDDEPTQPSSQSPSQRHHRHHHHPRRRRSIPGPVTISPASEPEEHPVQIIKPSTPRTPLADITPPSSTAGGSMRPAETQSTVAFDTEFERVEYLQQHSPRPRAATMPSLSDSVNLLTGEEARRLLLLYAESTPSLAGLIQEIAYTRVSRHRSHRERRGSTRVGRDAS